MDHTLVYTGHEKLLTPLELVCLRGPQKGKKFPLIEGRQTYGRDAGNHIVLDCPTVSKNHGMLLYQEEGKITIYDTLSRNGISTQGRKNILITLKIGQIIQIGSLVLKLVREGETTHHVYPKSNSHSWLTSKSLAFSAVFLVFMGSAMVFFPKIKFSQATHFFEEAKSAETPQTPTFKVLPAEPTHDAIQITKKVFQQPIVTKKIQRPALPLLPQGLNRSLKNLIKTDELEDQARASFASGQFQQAAQLWQQVLASDPNNQKAQEGLKSLQQISAIPSAAPSNPPQGDV